MIVEEDFVILGSDANPNPGPCAARVDERLAAEGWVRRHATDLNRLKESIELYESLGFEVLTRHLTSADYEPSCRGCIESTCPAHVLIYTRKSSNKKLGVGNPQSQGDIPGPVI